MSSVPSQKRLLIYLSIILVLLVTASYLFIVHPTFAEMDQLKGKINQAKTSIQVSEGKLNEQSGENTQIEYILPEHPATEQVVLHLRNSEKATSSQIRSLTFEEENKEEEKGSSENQPASNRLLQSLFFSIEISSPDLDAVKKFINSMEAHNRLYKVRNIELPINNEKAEAPIIYTVEMETYYQ